MNLHPTFVFQNPKLHWVRSTEGQCPRSPDWGNSFSAGVQMPFSPGLFPTRGVRTASSYSTLNVLVFVCKSAEQIT